MKNTSIWQATSAAASSFPQLFGDETADVVVIGGGISGLTAAMLLSDAGKKVILLEALKVGMGTTGNSTGNLYVTVDEHLSSISKKWGEQVMKDVLASRGSAIELIRRTVSRHQLSCGLQEVSFNLFLEKKDDAAEKLFDAEQKAFSEAGLKTSFSDPGLLPFPVLKMLSVHGQAQFQPLAYARQLAEKISGSCKIYEQSAVTDIDHSKGIVRTAAGSVKAEHIIMATHTPKGVWMVQTLLGAYREHGVAAELNGDTCPPGIFWSLHDPKHSIRSYQAANKNYVMVIGDKYKTGQAKDTTSYVRGLEKYLAERFKLGGDSYTWGGQQYRPADGLPYIGSHSEKLYFLTGFATDGLVYGTLGAMILSDLILGRDNNWKELYKLKRFTPIKSFKEFFKEAVDNMGQYIPRSAVSAKMPMMR